MCGIVAYIGKREAFPVVVNGLKRLEYRGYDSAGITVVGDVPVTVKCRGKVAELEQKALPMHLSGTAAIGHTRWATHGEPNDINAHPHTSHHGRFTIVHNGIIENYSVLRKRLAEEGYSFASETDTEVLANLIEYVYLQDKMPAEMAVRIALSKVEGAYGIVVICRDEPDKLIAARKSSPLVVGIGEGEYFIASDATPIVEYTKSVIYLNDEDVAIVSRTELLLKKINNLRVVPQVQTVDLNIGEIDKGGYEHFMLKEIFEQSRSIKDTFRGRIASDGSGIHLGGLFQVLDRIIESRRIILVGCGTSWHAALVGEYLLEEFARIPVEVEYASEFRYRNPLLFRDDVVIAISQSGETADTLAAIRLARRSEALVLGICNVVGSSIARETQAGVYTHAGPEIGVASTKAFTAQVTVLAMMAFLIGYRRGILDNETYRTLIRELSEVPEKIEKILRNNALIKSLAERFAASPNCLYLGRGYLFPVALEGALKLKEISYIHAEGYPAAEMKHGPIALIDKNMPVVFLATRDKSYDKIVSNIQEVKARKGIVIAVVTEGDSVIRGLADHVIEIPEAHEAVSALLAVIPLQLFAYHIAVIRGCNVDQPRNLAKSVTVE
ncbi:MAG: glutamine--fructose-6-phosphate transaminase (isomerizing) [Bacteroidales bacterium]|jgi:glucosamine--fructose-6-phosphate aminotransferase (isomerizing)|nr:glutamine--fructose-6-phosphate transaminase (isomerizing) [Bacteroidales bacterium]